MIGYLRCVATADLPKVWPQAWPLLAPAVALWNGRHNETTLRVACEAEQTQLWTADEGGAVVAACLTSISDWPTGLRECHLEATGGVGNGHWCEWEAGIERWARSIGCDLMMIRGRRGWERVFEPAGFEYGGTVLVKDLRHAE